MQAVIYTKTKKRAEMEGIRAMKKEFENMLSEAERLKEKLEELESLEQNIQGIQNQANNSINEIVTAYQEEEKEMKQRIDKANQENERNRAEIVELMKQQLKEGEGFRQVERLVFLKSEVATHPLKMESMQQLADEIVIKASDQKLLGYYEHQERKAAEAVYKAETEAANILQTMRDSYILGCLSCLDPYIAQRRVASVCDKYKVFEEMRKEEIEE